MSDIRTKNINAVDRRPVQHDLRRHSQFPETRVPAGVLTGSVEGTRTTQGILVASAVLLESSEVGVPLPGPGDVLVQVGAASVHPGDYFIMTGEPYVVRLAFGLCRPRHGIPGRDLARRGGSGRQGCHRSPPPRRGVRLEHRWNARGVRLRPGGQPRVRACQPVGRGRGSGAHVGHDGVAGIARDRERSTGPDGAGHGRVGRRGLLRRPDRQGVWRRGDGCVQHPQRRPGPVARGRPRR